MAQRDRMRSLLALVLFAGCGSTESRGSPDAAIPDDDGGCQQSSSSAPSAPANGQLGGTWASLEITVSRVNGFDSVQVARNIYLYQHSGPGAGDVSETMCHLQIDDANGLISTRVLPSFAPSIPKQDRTDSMTADAQGGYQFTMVKHWVTRGVTLANIDTDPLPTSPTDPRIGDWDMDSHPGMTLLLSGLLTGKAYVIQRDWTVLNGKQLDADHIEGTVMWNDEQVYLGSDPPSIKDLAPATYPDPDPSKHVFQMVRLPSGSDCAYVLAHQCTLFHP